ncbi:MULTISPECIES: phosphoenolpyruvate--protein phosphotransferase [Thermoactinomyces]|uniref:Phosphoenolpyruvate-protein phosphotransferase n=1 Tax=Thermoactinomyces daqus TaxID=1329516 RepID=A0A7W1XB16_9BACL|nr:MULTISPECIES: phosphoenolpyruvate--protein phosphotransferase [Thermoactinomyces]MBA4543319.1 phosphoenolpyruvate--protein phosphotransferase [Thermoactinomyces daqus]MBH8604695.1 phosphoenolpyruvate--protein phosphotransferase [Thermoactinomyces sp. CICC 10522]MBH8606844.1 phosphoenolpyruvate--protein phosphotransferase [Thermoactinomyces sp. CICC 10521]
MSQTLQGVGAAPGLKLGQAVWWRKEKPVAPSRTITDPKSEIEKLDQAIAQAKEQIEKLREIAAERMGEEEAAVFDAHFAFLDDPAFTGEMKNRIENQKKNAEAVCQDVTEEMGALMASLDDEYMKARADDIRDVGSRLLLILLGKQPFDPSLLTPGSVVIAEELTPSDTAQFPEGVAGMVTAKGSKTAHAAIMARTLGIPAVLGLGSKIEQIKDGDTIVVDGDKGTIQINPDQDVINRVRTQIEQQEKARALALKEAKAEAKTADGKRIQVFANIGSLSDIEIALKNHAEGVGLFRTEFLYLENDHWPTEEEQYQAYAKVLSSFGERPVVIRTLDIGGDKELPYAKLPKEENPFLGHRAIRFCLANPDLFKTQLRALLRASVHGNLWIMFPMIENCSEIRQAKALLNECREELISEGVQVADKIPVGIMVEIPAAAIAADLLAKEVDFMSIGTNDLTQYTLAADRGNEQVAHLYDAAHPAVLRLVKMTCDAAAKANILVGMCGELAGDPSMTELLIGLGLAELSMSASTIPEVKQQVRSTDTAEAKKLAEQAILLEDGDQVRNLAKKG